MLLLAYSDGAKATAGVGATFSPKGNVSKVAFPDLVPNGSLAIDDITSLRPVLAPSEATSGLGASFIHEANIPKATIPDFTPFGMTGGHSNTLLSGSPTDYDIDLLRLTSPPLETAPSNTIVVVVI
ncbi:hypothetical protein AAG906_041123 [Vitis piasezkii]